MLGGGFYTRLAIEALLLGCVALSVDILLGFAGLLSPLGQAAYFGLAAYIAALMYLHVTQSFWLVLLTVCASVGVLSFLLGAVAIRAKELLRAHHLRCRRDPVEDHPQHARSAAPTA